MSEVGPESVFLDVAGVYVTNTRAVFNGVTYSIANITSVRTAEVKDDPAPVVIVTLVVGVVAVIMCRCAGQPELSWLAGAIAVALAFWIPTRFRTAYVVVLRSAGSETHAFVSFHKGNCQIVADAVTNAIVARG